MRKTILAGALVAAASLTLSGCATPLSDFPITGDSLGLSPYADWKELETTHFRITFPAELADVARQSANYYEEAHELLSERLNWVPDQKVQVLIVDNADAANGMTATQARFGMLLYVTPPDNWFSTYYYDNWLRFLILHEYTHFLNMDTTGDYAQVLRRIFGDSFLPNALWPRWMAEGLAVYMETRLTHSGRGRSPYYEMILRAAVEANVLDTHNFITLDRVNGDNPYYPDGETAYLFGYQLMNQIAGDKRGRYPGDSALGEMSFRSGSRIPYLINSNLQAITGKDWYSYWDSWVENVRARARQQLARIKSHPVTPFNKLTTGGRETLGSSVSPDGRWIAFSHESEDKRMSLNLIDLQSGEKRTLTNKILGASVSFTPDSRKILYSSLRRRGGYATYSDLAIYDVESGATNWISTGLRARDPDLSKDGRKVAFTIASPTKTSIAVANVNRASDEFSISEPKILFSPENFDAVHGPKFSADGKFIYFTLHKNGQTSEELMELEIDTGKRRTLVSNGKFNRFPSVGPDGNIYFISDRTGVENLYRISPAARGTDPECLTNVTTGLAFPNVAANGKVYASVFSHTGWDLAELSLSPSSPGATRMIAEAIAPPPAPAADSDSGNRVPNQSYETKGYSVYPSILPRQWSPLLLYSPTYAYVGAQVLGFDAVDRHRYLLFGAYDTTSQTLDYIVRYTNRSFGPSLTLAVDKRISSKVVDLSTWEVLAYTRETEYWGSLSYPIRWTYSSLTPTVSFGLAQSSYFEKNSTGAFAIVEKSRTIPSIDTTLTFANTESSPLAITSEGGRSTQIGTRSYFPSGQKPIWKGLIKDTEYIHVARNTVLVPSAKASWVSRVTDDAAVNLQGRSSGTLVSSLTSDSLDELGIRGYPSTYIEARGAATAALDFRFPLFRIFRGWGTNPAYLDELFGFTFAEATWIPMRSASLTLPSAGAGLRLSTEFLLNVPLVFSVEYHQGFQKRAFGTGELFFQMGMANFNF